MNYNRLNIIIFCMLLFACSKENEPAPVQIWRENIGSRTDLPFLPDGNVNYFGYSFMRKQGDKIGIRFNGQYGYARYMSYNAYDNQTRSTLASLIDVDIAPDAGSSNPFITLTQSAERNYTVNLLPDIPGMPAYPNTLYYPDEITNVGTLLRYYLPEGNNYANVPLPDVEAFNIETGEAVELPTPLAVSFKSFNDKLENLGNLVQLTTLLQKPEEHYFYRFSGMGLFQNNDTKYLFCPVHLRNNEVIMFRFIPPSYPHALSEFPTADVRYYSICIGDVMTYNYVTHEDAKLKVADDGFIYVVVAREEPDVVAKAEGLNFIRWPNVLKDGLILYRNLLPHPSYEYPMTLVPDLVENLGSVGDPLSIAAHTYLGDHGPSAVKMSKEDYLADFGGFEVDY